jgi:hypothetical protein
MSFTLTVSQPSSILSCDIYPPLALEKDTKYEIGLVSFCTFNSVPNIDESNNKFYYGKNEVFVIPVGNYEIQDLTDCIKAELNAKNIYFNIFPNLNILKVLLKCTVDVDFTKSDSFGELLGFNKRVLKAKEQHYADKIVDIMKVHTIDIQSNISSGSYHNGIPSHSLHMFAPKVGPGYKIVEAPHDIIYLPIDVTIIDNITLKICDQHSNIVNFRGEEVTIRLHIRKAP